MEHIFHQMMVFAVIAMLFGGMVAVAIAMLFVASKIADELRNIRGGGNRCKACVLEGIGFSVETGSTNHGRQSVFSVLAFL